MIYESSMGKYIQFEQQIDLKSMGFIANVAAQVADLTDKLIVDAIIEEAKRNKITDLYLIDRQFVMEALQEKIMREKQSGFYYEHVGPPILSKEETAEFKEAFITYLNCKGET